MRFFFQLAISTVYVANCTVGKLLPHFFNNANVHLLSVTTSLERCPSADFSILWSSCGRNKLFEYSFQLAIFDLAYFLYPLAILLFGFFSLKLWSLKVQNLIECYEFFKNHFFKENVWVFNLVFNLWPSVVLKPC